MNNRLPQSVPLARLSDLYGRDDADRIAYRVYQFDAVLKRFNSRKALEAFCKDGSALHAVMKTPVHPNMITNRNTQRTNSHD